MTKFLATCCIMTLFSFPLHAMHETEAQLAAEFTERAHLFSQAVQRNNQESLRLRKVLKKFKKQEQERQEYEQQRECPCCNSCVLQ